VNLQALNTQVIALAKEVGIFILNEVRNFHHGHIERKGRNNLVSYVDKESERLITDRLSELLPEAGFVAEEGTGSRNMKGYNWIVDPLDGTTNFIHGIPFYSISIALMHDTEILTGVVYDPNSKECFHAVRGSGAFLNEQKIGVSVATQLSESLIATGFPYEHSEKMRGYLELLHTFVVHCHGFRRIGSAALDLAYVAAGRVDAFYEYSLHAWDVAAGALIVQEAGGKVTDFGNGTNYIFGGQILAAGKIHAQLYELIQKHLPH